MRRVLITGSASGIGAATALRMAGPDTAFVIHARKNRAGCEEVAREVEARGGSATILLADLGEPGAATALASDAIKAMGGIDVLVANAGFADFKQMAELTRSDLDRSYQAMQASFLDLVAASLPHLKTPNGRVVTISSAAAHVLRKSYPMYPASGAAKAATEVLVRALAVDLAPFGATANAVAPGLIAKHASAHRVHNDGEEQKAIDQIPMGRKGQPQEVAALVAFLCGAEAGYVTGQVIHINGGLS